MIYRSKPTEVSAHEWPMLSGEESKEQRRLVHARLQALETMPLVHTDGSLSFHCIKSKTFVHIGPGDFIIEEPDGVGAYPCVRDVFLQRYELPEPGCGADQEFYLAQEAMEAIRGVHPVSRGPVLENAQDALRVESGL